MAKKNKKSKKESSNSSRQSDSEEPQQPIQLITSSDSKKLPPGSSNKLGSQKELKNYISQRVTSSSQDKLISMNRLLSKQQELTQKNRQIREGSVDKQSSDSKRGKSFKELMIQNINKKERSMKSLISEKKSDIKKKEKKKKAKSSSSESSKSLNSSSNDSSSQSSAKKKKKKKKKKKAKKKRKRSSSSSSDDRPKKKSLNIKKLKKSDNLQSPTKFPQSPTKSSIPTTPMLMDELESEDERMIEDMRREFIKNKIERKKQKKASKQLNFIDNDEITSEDCLDEQKKFKRMDYKSREKHIIHLWNRSFIKGRAGYRVLKWANDIRQKILRFGITGKKQIQDVENFMQIQWWILLPNGGFKTSWNSLMVILLLYTATYMPYKTCFIDEEDNPLLDYTIDILFTLDILVTFISADTEDDGTLIHKQKIIAERYLKGWFLFDFVAVAQSLLPFILTPELLSGADSVNTELAIIQGLKEKQLQEQADAEYQKLLRLLRIPRLYKMIRIFRIVKVLKISKNFKLLSKIKRAIKLNAAIMRMVQGVFTAILFTHIFACIWFMSAKFSDFSEDTWVYRRELTESPPIEQYLVAMHWATQTITTVGYGDVGAKSIPEIIISLFWMLFGVGFYSFIIGNFSSIISGNDQISATIEKRVRNLANLTQKAGIPYELSRKIKGYIETNYESLYSLGDETQLIRMLPPSLRDELLSFIYGKIVAKIQFFKDCEDQDFLWHVLPILKSIQLITDDILYFRGDYAEDIYFIIHGTIKMYSQEGNVFHKVTDGQMLGESDTLLDLPRISKAVATTNISLMALSKSQFETLFQFCQDYCFKMIMDAKTKRDFLIQKMNKIDEKIRVKKETKQREEKRREIEMMEKINRKNKVMQIVETKSEEEDEEQSQISVFSKVPIKGLSKLKAKFMESKSRELEKTQESKFHELADNHKIRTASLESIDISNPSVSLNQNAQQQKPDDSSVENSNKFPKQINRPILSKALSLDSDSDHSGNSLRIDTKSQRSRISNNYKNRKSSSNVLKLQFMGTRKISRANSIAHISVASHKSSVKQPTQDEFPTPKLEEQEPKTHQIQETPQPEGFSDAVQKISGPLSPQKEESKTSHTPTHVGPPKKIMPLKRLSMRMQQAGAPPLGSNVPPGTKAKVKAGPNQLTTDKKSLLPARRLSTSRTLAQKVIEKTFGSENKEKIFQQYPQLQKLNEDKDLNIEQVKGSNICREEDKTPNNETPSVRRMSTVKIAMNPTGQRRPPASRQSNVFGGAPQTPKVPVTRGPSADNNGAMNEGGSNEDAEEKKDDDIPHPSTKKLTRSLSIENQSPTFLTDNNLTPKPLAAPQIRKLPPKLGNAPISPNHWQNLALGLRAPKMAPKQRLSMRMPPGKKQQSSLMVSGVKNQQEEIKRYEQKKKRLQENAEHDIESQCSHKKREKSNDNSMIEIKKNMEKKQSRKSLKKNLTTNLDEPDTELNFLRKAVNKNMDNYQAKLQNKFKIQKNMFSDVVINLGGMKNPVLFDDNDPKNEVDNILQDLEKQHGKIQDFETQMQSPMEIIQRQFISQNTLEKIRYQLLLKEYLQTKAKDSEKKKDEPDRINVRKKTSIIKISGMNLRDQCKTNYENSKVIIKGSKKSRRFNPILELRVNGLQSSPKSQSDGESSVSHSNVSKNDPDDLEEMANIIQNTFNTSSKYNKYKVNTHDFLMNQLSENMNEESSNIEEPTKTGIVTQSIIQKRAKDSCNNLQGHQEYFKGHPKMLEIVKFNKDANLVALNVFEILTAAKTYKKQRDLLIDKEAIEEVQSSQETIIGMQDGFISEMEKFKQEVDQFVQLKRETAQMTRPVQPINEEFARKNSKNLKKERSIIKLEKRIFDKRIEI